MSQSICVNSFQHADFQLLTANSGNPIKELIPKGLKGSCQYFVGITRDFAILYSLQRADENFSPSVVVIAMPMTMTVARSATWKEAVAK